MDGRGQWAALGQEEKLQRRGDLYNEDSRQVSSEPDELCAPTSPYRSREGEVMRDGRERLVVQRWSSRLARGDAWAEAQKKAPPRTR